MLVLLLVTGLRVTPHICTAAYFDNNQTLLSTNVSTMRTPLQPQASEQMC